MLSGKPDKTQFLVLTVIKYEYIQTSGRNALSLKSSGLFWTESLTLFSSDANGVASSDCPDLRAYILLSAGI